jgi:glutathione synthase/RimK-type ligase-like ATP-grasp enzyme
MAFKIAIQPDEVVHPNGKRQSFSERWIELARAQDIEAVPVDVFSRDVISSISACDAFMWRCSSSAHPRVYAKRLLYAVEAGLGLPVFPSLKSSWYFEDKIGQCYFFHTAGIPTPATDIFWTRQQAERFCDAATYPFVLKLAGGHQSSNVRLVRNRDEALFYVDQLFIRGVVSLGYRSASRPRLLLRRLRTATEVVKGRNPSGSTAQAELQYGYFYAQEFLPDNGSNVCVTIIGNRAFAFRCLNRPGDFRTSGTTGRMDWDPETIGEDAVRLAYQVARKLEAQTVAMDILRRGSEPVVVELTLNYASWSVRECPGHWILKGEAESGDLEWVQGSLCPEDAIFEDFVAEVGRSMHIPV